MTKTKKLINLFSVFLLLFSMLALPLFRYQRVSASGYVRRTVAGEYNGKPVVINNDGKPVSDHLILYTAARYQEAPSPDRSYYPRYKYYGVPSSPNLDANWRAGGYSGDWHYRFSHQNSYDLPAGYLFYGWQLPGQNITKGPLSNAFHGTQYEDQTIKLIFRKAVKPRVTLAANNSTGSITVNQNTSLQLKWSVSDYPNDCRASGAWLGKLSRMGGTKNMSNITSSSGSKTFKITCKNEYGSFNSTVTVHVAAKQTSMYVPPAISIGNPTRPSNNNSETAKNTNDQKEREEEQDNKEALDVPPAKPLNFTAYADSKSATVSLSWLPDYSKGESVAFEIDRSLDNKSWEMVAEATSDLMFTDRSVAFDTNYHYRIRAVDSKGNKSGYTHAEATTATFAPNVTVENGGEIYSLDKTIEVAFPEGAVSEDVFCSLNEQGLVNKLIDDYIQVSGGQEITCRTSHNTLLFTYKKPLTIIFSGSDLPEEYNSGKLFVFRSGEWQEAAEKPLAEQTAFNLEDSYQFALFAKPKTPPLWPKILLGIALIGGTGIGALLLRRRYALQQIRKKQDYFYKQEHGLW